MPLKPNGIFNSLLNTCLNSLYCCNIWSTLKEVSCLALEIKVSTPLKSMFLADIASLTTFKSSNNPDTSTLLNASLVASVINFL